MTKFIRVIDLVATGLALTISVTLWFGATAAFPRPART